MVNVTEASFAGITTVVGTVASVVSLLNRVTVTGTLVTILRVTVPVNVPPFSLIDGLLVDTVSVGAIPVVKFQSDAVAIPWNGTPCLAPDTLIPSTANQPAVASKTENRNCIVPEVGFSKGDTEKNPAPLTKPVLLMTIRELSTLSPTYSTRFVQVAPPSELASTRATEVEVPRLDTANSRVKESALIPARLNGAVVILLPNKSVPLVDQSDASATAIVPLPFAKLVRPEPPLAAQAFLSTNVHP